MDDRSANPAASDAGSPPDRVGSLSARLSEALTAVGIAVRRREAEIELIDRTLAASSDAQSAAARQAADRMARVRSEHAEELELMQRARRALEDATTVAGELSLELESRIQESDESVREADALRRSLDASEIELGERRARVAALEGEVSSLGEDLEQARRALAARESELEQVWRELDVKTREAQELARLMGAFTPGVEIEGAAVNGVHAAVVSAVEVKGEVEGARGEVEEEGAKDEEEQAKGEEQTGEEQTGEERGAKGEEEEQTGEEQTGEDQTGDEEEEALEPPPATPSVEHMSAAAFDLLPATSQLDADGDGGDDGVAADSDDDDDPPAPPDETEVSAVASSEPAMPRFAEAPDIDLEVGVVHDVIDEMAGVEAMPPPTQASAAGDDIDVDVDALDLREEESDSPAEAATAEANGAVADDAVADAAVDISVDDWGAVVEDEPAVALPSPSTASKRPDIDGELQAYLSAVGSDDEGEQAAPSGRRVTPDALFKATSGISEFRCATPEEVRLAGALQLQSWRASELAQLLGIEVAVVRSKLQTYHERGLVEVVTG